MDEQVCRVVVDSSVPVGIAILDDAASLTGSAVQLVGSRATLAYADGASATRASAKRGEVRCHADTLLNAGVSGASAASTIVIVRTGVAAGEAAGWADPAEKVQLQPVTSEDVMTNGVAAHMLAAEYFKRNGTVVRVGDRVALAAAADGARRYWYEVVALSGSSGTCMCSGDVSQALVYCDGPALLDATAADPRMRVFAGYEAEVADTARCVRALLSPALDGTPRGVAVESPDGCGAWLVAAAAVRAACADDPSVRARVFDVREALRLPPGDAAKAAKAAVEGACQAAPAVLLLQGGDALRRDKNGRRLGAAEEDVAAVLAAAATQTTARVVLVMATHERAPVLPGFDAVVHVGPPDADARASIFCRAVRRGDRAKLTKAAAVAVTDVAQSCAGATGADIARWARCALMAAAARHHGGAGSVLTVDAADVRAHAPAGAAAAAVPYAIANPNVRWGDIAGNSAVKQRLREMIEWPRAHAGVCERFGLRRGGGVLLYGPPGCGKTLFAKAVATESGMPFVTVKVGELMSPYVGESEERVRAVFAAARAAAPCVLFFDEIDAVATRRGSSSGGDAGATDRVVNAMLVELDGVDGGAADQGIVVLAATNRIDVLDEALIRPGRLGLHVEVPLPDADARVALLEAAIERCGGGEPSVDARAIAADTNGWSGARLVDLVESAARAAAREVITGAAGPERQLCSGDLTAAMGVMMGARGALN